MRKTDKIEQKLIKLARKVVEKWGADVESGKPVSETKAADALVRFVKETKALLQEYDAERESSRKAEESFFARLRGQTPKPDGQS